MGSQPGRAEPQAGRRDPSDAERETKLGSQHFDFEAGLNLEAGESRKERRKRGSASAGKLLSNVPVAEGPVE